MEKHSKAEPLHILFFPFFAPGHMVPMVDLAKLFSSHGVKSTILTTHASAPLSQPTIDHFNSNSTHHHHLLPIIALQLVPFPSAEAGLPPGVENVVSVTTPEMRAKMIQAISLFRQPFDQILREQLIDAVITDNFFVWSSDAAAEFGVLRLVFSGSGVFNHCVGDNLLRYDPMSALQTEDETVVIPGLPHKIEMLRTQMLDPKKRPELWKLALDMREAAEKSFGDVVNSFYDLESHYVEHYRNFIGRRAWLVGPLSLYNRDVADNSRRGNKVSIDWDECLNWLDSKQPGSVLYVCFGTLSHISNAQLREIDASGKDFIWVVRDTEGGLDWLPEGLEERRGLIIRGWAPQILILNHTAVGAFLTHCGWNSCTEGVSAGVPLIIWPLFADQFYNEKVVVEIEKVGVAIGAKEFGFSLDTRSLIMADVIEKAVERVMGEGEEAAAVRKRARELRRRRRGRWKRVDHLLLI
ncbi:scopoletin glucosyltransferase-like [Typha latifolia]|uniref:scopoletin glucosyltransferase-like n=1 Tax=Typha latifolia TaxID=4733 RepID=UPI003C30E754